MICVEERGELGGGNTMKRADMILADFWLVHPVFLNCVVWCGVRKHLN